MPNDAVAAEARAAGRDGRITLGVLGDSDSHAFQDPLAGGFGTPMARGGPWQASTLQWTEILARLRPDAIDQGVLGPVGRRGALAWLQRRIGAGPVRQYKQDFQDNLAYSGATCEDLNRADAGQVDNLLPRMDADPARWRQRAFVVIRIGINNLGRVRQLEAFADSGLDAAAAATVKACADAVGTAIQRIRARHPQVGVIVVGVLDNADWPRLHGRWHDPAALARIRAVLDAYDHRLQGIVAGLTNAAFIDDRAAFRRWFGGRGADGRPAYTAIDFGGSRPLTMTEGDSPDHAVLADGHAGTVWNGLWADALLTVLNRLSGAQVPPITTDELLRLADPDDRSGLRPRRDAAPPARLR